ncbi:hypothetical protein PI124_g8231 [Phytophthora idaei]|nr:hypothetical protein PI125_g1200 [Phytophthora idaei]KAG3140926.1 hypothetical protein PI126_g15740 [Phytophthora idaei]KAG3247053.1 hypothetical protein PI124_g8231 [Phytophthora idaei]
MSQADLIRPVSVDEGEEGETQGVSDVKDVERGVQRNEQ